MNKFMDTYLIKELQVLTSLDDLHPITQKPRLGLYSAYLRWTQILLGMRIKTPSPEYKLYLFLLTELIKGLPLIEKKLGLESETLKLPSIQLIYKTSVGIDIEGDQKELLAFLKLIYSYKDQDKLLSWWYTEITRCTVQKGGG